MCHHRSPSDDALALLRESLGARSASLEFARAVLVQIGRPAGQPPDVEREKSAAARIAGVLGELDSAGGVFGRGPERLLASDSELLAAFFQNVDLLYAAEDPSADRVSGWIMGALEIAEREDGG